ncbi:MAG: hypothetical protein QNJ91_04935 [Gammaproteobacteria bacterium]|nr:hypothetical protein [Gammaproteobacteria bacterium]
MDEQQVDSELPDSRPARQGGPWKLILVVVVITLIGVWLVPSDEPDPADTAGDVAPSLLDLPPTAAGGKPALPDALQEPLVDTRPGARARALIADMRASGEVQLDTIFDAAERAQQDGELDDAYLLYFFAAREGHAGAALTLGSQADPANRDAAAGLFDTPDLTQAHKWYQVAANNGDPEGRKRLSDLRQRVEALAADGDPQARRIALQWR